MKYFVFACLFILNTVYSMEESIRSEQPESTTQEDGRSSQRISPSYLLERSIEVECSIEDIKSYQITWDIIRYYQQTARIVFNPHIPGFEIKPFNLDLCNQRYCAHKCIPLEVPHKIGCQHFNSNSDKEDTINLVCIIDESHRLVFKLNFQKPTRYCCMLLCTVLDGLQEFCRCLLNFEEDSYPENPILETVRTQFAGHENFDRILKIFRFGCGLYGHIETISDTFREQWFVL